MKFRNKAFSAFVLSMTTSAFFTCTGFADGGAHTGADLTDRAKEISEVALQYNWANTGVEKREIKSTSMFICNDEFRGTFREINFSKGFQSYLVENVGLSAADASNYTRKVVNFIIAEKNVVAKETNGVEFRYSRCPTVEELAAQISILDGGAHTGTATITDDQARDIAVSGLATYNSIAHLKANSDERLFEGYGKIDSTNCGVKSNIITCHFPTTEATDRDEDVYTPNTLKVKLNQRTGTVKVDIEFGC